jgi:hypothetical protein
MKKTLSLILALILTFSMSLVAFAEDAVALTKDEAKAKAVAHINYDSEIPLGTYVTSGTYNHDAEGQIDVYNVTSTLLLKTGKTAVYKTTVDMYTGKIYSQSANFLDILSIFNKNISMDQAYSLALEAMGVDKANTSSLSKQEITTADGKVAYHFVFVEGFSEQYECTVIKYDGAIEDIKVSKYNEPTTDSPLSGLTNIFERIILIFKVLISKLNPVNLLDKISATDILKIFQALG